MVSAAASRFAWAFNDPAFSDVLIVLRVTGPRSEEVASTGLCEYIHGKPSGVSVAGGLKAMATTARCSSAQSSTTSLLQGTFNLTDSPSTTKRALPAFGGEQLDASTNDLQTEEIYIYAHSVILASSSEMMRSWLSRWAEEHPHPHRHHHHHHHHRRQEEEDEDEEDEDEDVEHGGGGHDGQDVEEDPQQQQQQRKRQGSRRQRQQRRSRSRRSGRGGVMRLQLDLGPEELAAGEAVVRFMYTQALDGVEDDEELLHCMLLADRWLLPDCAARCAARLQSTPAGSLSWRVRAALLGLPQGLAAASPHVAQLQGRVEGALMRTFRCPELMWEEPDNRQLLLSLPAPRLAQLLLAREDVQVTSENAVLALLSAWLEHNLPYQQLPTATTATTISTNCPQHEARGNDVGDIGSRTATTTTTTTTTTRGAGSSDSNVGGGADLLVSAVTAVAGGGGGGVSEEGLLELSEESEEPEEEEDDGAGVGGSEAHLTDVVERRDPWQEARAAAEATGDEVSAAGAEVEMDAEVEVEMATCCPPEAEVESLLRLVRYGHLTPHYRTVVAPLLPGLRGLRLHHELLAKAAADATAITQEDTSPPAPATTVIDASTATAAAICTAAPTAPFVTDSVVSSTPFSPPNEAAAAAGAGAAACKHLASRSRSTSASTSTSASPSVSCASLPTLEAASAGARPGVTAAVVTGAPDDGSCDKEEEEEVDCGECSCSSGSSSGGGGSVSPLLKTKAAAEASAVDGSATATTAADSAALPLLPPPPAVRRTSSTQATDAVSSVVPAPAPVVGPASVPVAATANVGDVGVLACAVPAAAAVTHAPTSQPVAAAAAAVAVATPQLPPRLQFNLVHRLEWCRDIRDVRIHLTGVGGPSQGGDTATPNLQLGPPVFLGGYTWHLATRFATTTPAPTVTSATPAPTATSATIPSTSTTTTAVTTTTTTAAVSASPAPGSAAGAVVGPALIGKSAASGRLQLQLGVVCTSPVGPPVAAASVNLGTPPRRRSSSSGSASSSGAAPGLSLASCTLSILDAAGKAAWQVTQAPCLLAAPQPPPPAASTRGGGAEEVGLGSGLGLGGGGGGVQRWECWHGLQGLEPSWWESGSALTTGGVLRLSCTLGLQA